MFSRDDTDTRRPPQANGAWPGSRTARIVEPMSDSHTHTTSPGGAPAPMSPKHRMLTLTLACLGGFLGLHRFYVGRWKSGALMLLTLGGLFVWWIVDVFLLLSWRFRDADGRLLGPTTTGSATSPTESGKSSTRPGTEERDSGDAPPHRPRRTPPPSSPGGG